MPMSSSCNSAISELLFRRRARRRLGEVFAEMIEGAEDRHGREPPSAQSEPSVITSQRSRKSSTFFWRSIPATILSTVSAPRVEPTRQGVHLPQLSLAQKWKAKRAWRAMSTVSSNTTMPPWPSIPPAASIAS